MLNSKSPLTDFIKSFLKDAGLPFMDYRSGPIAGDGSKRSFMRIIPPHTGNTYVVMENFPANEYLAKENSAYLMINKHLFNKGLPVPEIYRFDLAHGWFIIEDMGDRSLQDYALRNKERASLYEKTIDILFQFQIEGARDFNTDWCYQTRIYDESVMRRDEADYFRDSFLSNYLGMRMDWGKLDIQFDYLCSMASRADNQFLLHRDFQSRNIMINNNQPGILDWQAARLGPLAYDLASILIDPYVDLSAKEKRNLYLRYLSLIKGYEPDWIQPFERYFPYLAIQRNLQILGAFSFLSKVRGKAYFADYIAPALKSLCRLLDELADPELSYLNDLVGTIKEV
jgi:aminoglycoside/choline kinase family phosphotransferase